MGQTVATICRRLLGRKAGKSLLFRMVQRIKRLLNKLRRGVAETPPSDYQNPIYSNPGNNHYIDIGIDDLAFHSRIPEITVTLVETDDELPPVEQRPSEIEEHVLESLICNVAITKEEIPGSGVSYDTDNLSPVEERPSEIEEHVLESLICDVAITKAETTEGGVSYDTDNLSPAEKRPIHRRLGPYSSDQKILLVGEGDFSFSASLAVAFDDASNMIATSLDSFAYLVTNYKRATSNIEKLTSRGCKVIHGVDATRMANHLRLGSLKFDCIVYNFPHAGFANRQAPRNAHISKHQELVRGFMANAKTMIEPDGQIHITHKCRGFFLEWNLKMLGSTQGLRLFEESHFNFRDYPGYCTKFGYGGDWNFNCNPSKRYKFKLAS